MVDCKTGISLLLISFLLATANVATTSAAVLPPREDHADSSLVPRMKLDGGFRRTGLAWFTSRRKVAQVAAVSTFPPPTPSGFRATPPLPSNTPRHKKHSKLFQGYNKILHSVTGKRPFKFKAKNPWSASGRTQSSARIAADNEKTGVRKSTGSSDIPSSSAPAPGSPSRSKLERRMTGFRSDESRGSASTRLDPPPKTAGDNTEAAQPPSLVDSTPSHFGTPHSQRWVQQRSFVDGLMNIHDELIRRGDWLSSAGSSSSGSLSRSSSGSSSDSFPSPPRPQEPQKEPHPAPLRTLRPSTAKPPLHPSEPKPLPGGWDGEINLKKPRASRPKIYKGQLYKGKTKKGSVPTSTPAGSSSQAKPALSGKKLFPTKKASVSQGFKKMFKIAGGRITKPAHVNFKNRNRKPHSLQKMFSRIFGRSYDNDIDGMHHLEGRESEADLGYERRLAVRTADRPPKKRPAYDGSSSSSSSSSPPDKKQRPEGAEPNAAPFRTHWPPSSGRPPLPPKAPRPLPGGLFHWDGKLQASLRPSKPKVYKGEAAKLPRSSSKKKPSWPTPFLAEKNSKVTPKKVHFPNKVKSLTKGFNTRLHKVVSGRVTKPAHYNFKSRAKTELQKFKEKATAHVALLHNLGLAHRPIGGGQTSAQGGGGQTSG